MNATDWFIRDGVYISMEQIEAFKVWDDLPNNTHVTPLPGIELYMKSGRTLVLLGHGDLPVLLEALMEDPC